MTAETLTYDDRPAKQMIYPALIFMIIAMFVGVFLAFNTFVFPDYFSGEYVHFGRTRPVHVGGILLLFLLSANFGILYYIVPRLCGVRLWSYSLATTANSIWWFANITGNFSYPFGTNWGWEYAELPMWIGWLPIKALFLISWVLMAINFFATIAKRRYKKMYVSLWYTMGTLIWGGFTVAVGFFGLMFIPGGISRVNMSFFYVHNLVGLIFTPMGVAAAYYFIPKIANTPLWSHRLSMIGFWSIAFVYAWVGAHHIIHGPMSQWLQTTSIIFSMWLMIPVFTVITNFFMTMKGQWRQYSENPAIRFLMMGTVFYLLVCIQGPLQSLRNVNEITSKTDWIIGHSHISLYGTFAFFVFGAVYGMMPALTKRAMWSDRLSHWHFALNMVGAIPFFLSLTIGGFHQGVQWADWAIGSNYAEFHANLANLPFLQTIADMWYWWLVRAISGAIIWIANILFVVNVFNTVVLKPRQPQPAVFTGVRRAP